MSEGYLWAIQISFADPVQHLRHRFPSQAIKYNDSVVGIGLDVSILNNKASQTIYANEEQRGAQDASLGYPKSDVCFLTYVVTEPDLLSSVSQIVA